jgi:predicted  nucleic acid-binding Zn-ribbon protein
MLSVEILGQLRTLNHLAVERRRFPAHSREGCSVDTQIAAIRGGLPESILAYHDRLVARGNSSVAQVNGSNCGGCHLKLPSGVLSDMRTPGRFGVCPHCGVVLWSGDGPAPERVVPARGVRTAENSRAA